VARRGRRRGHKVAPAPGPYVPSLPMLGTTWYERGPAYWRRRVGLSLLVLCGLALDLLLVGSFLAGFWQDARTGAAVTAVVIVVFGIVAGVWTWRRAGRIDRPTGVGARDARLAARMGATTGILARAGSVVSSLVLVVLAILLVGPFVAAWLRTFDRELYVERRARATLGR
jgi:hypothetical protein